MRSISGSKQWQNQVNNGCKFRSFSTSSFISKIGHVNLMYSQMWLEDDEKWSETYYLITDLVGMSDYDIIRLFLKRNVIEGFHGEAKQHLGLKTYPLQEDRGIVRHLFLAMLVYVLLPMLCKHLLTKGGRKLHSIGELCQYLRQQCYTAKKSKELQNIIQKQTNRKACLWLIKNAKLQCGCLSL